MIPKLIKYKWYVVLSLIYTTLNYIFVDPDRGKAGVWVVALFFGMVAGIGLGATKDYLVRKIRYQTLGVWRVFVLIFFIIGFILADNWQQRFSIYIVLMSIGGFINLGKKDGSVRLPQWARKDLDKLTGKTFFEETLPHIVEQCRRFQNKTDWGAALTYQTSTLSQLKEAKSDLKRLYDEQYFGPLRYEAGMEEIRLAEEALDNLLTVIKEQSIGDNLLTFVEQQTSLQKDLNRLAPEIEPICARILSDHAAILEVIEGANIPSKQELLTIQASRMKQFDDIVKGYLKIKANQKNYYNPQERLTKAQLALEQFDLELDETLRQLNESDMMDFEVSLRMLKGETNDNKD